MRTSVRNRSHRWVALRLKEDLGHTGVLGKLASAVRPVGRRSDGKVAAGLWCEAENMNRKTRVSAALLDLSKLFPITQVSAL